MTRSDKWKKRPATQAYWDFKDKICRVCKLQRFELGDAYFLHAQVAMPKSWSKKQREEMLGKKIPAHQVKPDIDNMEKSINDCLKSDDQTVFFTVKMKVWGETDQTTILNLTEDEILNLINKGI